MDKMWIKVPGTLLLTVNLVHANPPTVLGAIDATIGVKNNTNDTIEVSCKVGVTDQGDYTLGGPQTIGPQNATTFSGVAGDGCALGNQNDAQRNQIVCNYTDQTTGNTGTFTLGACQTWVEPTRTNPSLTNYENSISVSPNSQPPTPYYCTATTADYTEYPEDFYCSNGNPSASYTSCKVEAYFAVGTDGDTETGYKFHWDNVKQPPAIGQRIADNLAAKLMQEGKFGSLKGNYDSKQQRITIETTTENSSNPNPYDGMNSISQCRSACTDG